MCWRTTFGNFKENQTRSKQMERRIGKGKWGPVDWESQKQEPVDLEKLGHLIKKSEIDNSFEWELQYFQTIKHIIINA